MRLVFLSCCISMCLLACRLSQSSKISALDVNMVNKHLVFLDANFQYSNNGNKGKSYIDYYVYLIVREKNKKLLFDSAWSHERSFETFISRKSIQITTEPIPILSGDTIILRISVLREIPEQQVFKPTIKFDDTMLFRYFVDKKPFYFTIKKINQLDNPKYQ